MAKPGKRMGRPPGSGAPEEQQRRPRSVRLDAARWSKLQKLGASWLENAIDNAGLDCATESRLRELVNRT